MWTRLPLHLVSSRSASSRAQPWFESETFRSAFHVISEGLEAGAGLILVLGDAGAGKTTLMRALRDVYARAGRETLLYDARAIHDPLRALQDDLQRRPRDRAPDSPIALLDGADRLPRDRLAEIALAGRESKSPVQLIVSGRPELWARLQLPDYAEINSRVELSASLSALRRHEIGFYLRHGSLAAGRPDRRFEHAALEKLYAYSGGNPGIVDRIGARLDGVAAETIGAADIDAVIASLENGRAEGRLTIAQFGATDAEAPGQHPSSRVTDARKGRIVAASAAILIVAAALAAASLRWWKDDLPALTLVVERPGAPRWSEAESAAVPATQVTATQASATQAPTVQASAAQGAAGPMPTAQAAGEPAPTAQVSAASERQGSPGDRSGAADEQAFPDNYGLHQVAPLQKSSRDPVATPDDATVPRRGYESGATESAEQLAAVGSPAAPPERARGIIDDARAEQPAPVASQPDVWPAEASSPPAIDQASPRDEPAARDPGSQAVDASSPPASIVMLAPAREQPTPPAEAPSLRASTATPPAREPVVVQSASREVPNLVTPPARPERRPEADAFMKKGMQLLDMGDVASARLLFERAADLGLSEACTAMGETFDPAELGRRRIIGMRGQPDTALKWYRLGDERGDPRARERILRLAGSVP